MRDITIVPQDYVAIYTKTDTVMKKFDDGCEVYEVKEDRRPLVRCKDCKHRYMDGEVTHYYWCRLHDRPVDDADYCAWGEESEDKE